MRKITGREVDATRLDEIMQQMRSWSELAEPITGELPHAVSAALATGRPELIDMFQPARPMTKGLVAVVRSLLQTNIALQQHAQEVAKRANMLDEQLRGLMSTCRRIDDFANFRRESDDEGDI